MLENDKAKLIWDFEFKLRKTTTSRRPDLILEEKDEKKIWICDMACPQQRNLEKKRDEKRTNYRQLAFEMRERRPEYFITIVPVVIGALGGGMKHAMKEMAKLFKSQELVVKTAAEMQKVILLDSETLLRKVLSGQVQSD